MGEAAIKTGPTGIKPSATNTGPRVATVKYEGTHTFTKTQTISGKAFSGEVVFDAEAGEVLTLVDCSINGNNAYYAVRNEGAGRIVLQYCEMINVQAAALYGNSWTASYCKIHGLLSDAVKLANNTVLECSYIYDYGRSAAAHADGAQAVNGVGIVVRGNFFDGMRVGGGWNNSGCFLNGSHGPITKPMIDGNWFAGGTNYAIYLQGGQSGAVITNNEFEGTYQFGHLSNPTGMNRPATWGGNVDGDGKQVVLGA